MKKRQLKRHLTDHGCRLAREAAKHELWENPATVQRTTVPRHREIKMPTGRAGSAASSASLPHRAPDSQTPVRKRVPKYVPNSAILTRPNLS